MKFSEIFEVFQKCQNKTEHAIQSQGCTNAEMLKNVVPGSPYERKDSNYFFMKFQVESKIKCEEIKKESQKETNDKEFFSGYLFKAGCLFLLKTGRVLETLK